MDFLQELPDTICVRKGKNAHFRAHYLFLANKFFWLTTVQTRKHYKHSGFSGNCPKPKMTPFFGKRCFLTWVKKWVLLTMFLKSCVFLKTLFLQCFLRNRAFAIQTLYAKNRKLMKNRGLFWNMAKGLFFVCFFFQASMSLCFFVW